MTALIAKCVPQQGFAPVVPEEERKRYAFVARTFSPFIARPKFCSRQEIPGFFSRRARPQVVSMEYSTRISRSRSVVKPQNEYL